MTNHDKKMLRRFAKKFAALQDGQRQYTQAEMDAWDKSRREMQRIMDAQPMLGHSSGSPKPKGGDQ